MNYTLLIVVVFIIIGLIWLGGFRKTKLLSNFPFEEGEEIVFEEEPVSLVHKQSTIVDAKSNRNYNVLMKSVVKITNKKRIIFAQKYKGDALIYAVFSVNDLTEEQKNSWKKLGYTFATLANSDVVATTSEKANYELTLTGRMPDDISKTTGINDFIMQIYTNDLSKYEKNLDIKIEVK